MKRVRNVSVVLMAFAGLCAANPMQTAAPLPSIRAVADSIRTELESHGDRVLGKDSYHWSTRLEKIEDCRAEFSVRIVNNTGEPTVTVDTVNFSLGALDSYGIAMQKNHWLQLPCFDHANCVFSSSTCSRVSKDGIVIDCTTPSQKRSEAFSLELDGDPGAAERLKWDLVRAVDTCRQPVSVSF